MLKRNHFLTGATFLLAASAVTYATAPEIIDKFAPETSQKILFCASFLATTSLPDIDKKMGFIQHRTLTHSLLFLAILFMAFINLPYLNGITLACFHHILIDSISDQGVPWLWPFSRTITYSSGASVVAGHFLKLYRTGEISEFIFAILIVILNLLISGYFIFQSMPNLRYLLPF